MESLSQIVRKYLDANGISDKFFQNYIGCSQPLCSLWFKGERRLNPEQIKKTHDFLQGKHIKTIEDILKEGE